VSYHHYSPVPSGELQETEKGTCDASEYEVVRTQVQRASASSSVRFVLCSDLSTSSSGKYDTTATSAERDP
jgi:hypothetical protein